MNKDVDAVKDYADRVFTLYTNLTPILWRLKEQDDVGYRLLCDVIESANRSCGMADKLLLRLREKEREGRTEQKS